MNELFHIPLFAGLDAATLQSIGACFSPAETHQAGERLFAAEDTNSDVYFLLSGKVRLSLLSADGKLISYRDIAPGDYFGWLSAIDASPRLTDATALEKASVRRMASTDFQNILFAHPSIGQKFLHRAAGVIRRYTERIGELTEFSARRRIILELTRRASGADDLITIISHDDFATWAGTSRETVSRTFAELEKEGILQKHPAGYRLKRLPENEDIWLA